jgi:translation initiation factor IF-2
MQTIGCFYGTLGNRIMIYTCTRERIRVTFLPIQLEGYTGSFDAECSPPVQVIPTSGLTGHGLDDLMEGLILQSEVMDLRADAEAHAEGIVMDARLEKGLGVVADCIVRWGNMKRGDVVVSGTQIAKVKMLKDCK